MKSGYSKIIDLSNMNGKLREGRGNRQMQPSKQYWLINEGFSLCISEPRQGFNDCKS